MNEDIVPSMTRFMAVIPELFLNNHIGLRPSQPKWNGGPFEPSGLKTNVMPIAVEAVSLEKYLAWLNEQA